MVKVMFQFLPDICHTLFDVQGMANTSCKAGDLGDLGFIYLETFGQVQGRVAPKVPSSLRGLAFPWLQVGFVVWHLAQLVSVVGTGRVNGCITLDPANANG